ncbi:phage tail protein [Brevibacillus sp. SYSU BS000544]|uniref:phage tail protein n=1 Tax=Brevibacillus sp. SYSU BS000544 TaxID=3416443 RepID=UPI003CE465B7
MVDDAFIGEIRMFAGNFAPQGWAFCNGQLLSIAQNTALFSILGVTYGGDGKTTFALPSLNARAPMHAGQGSGLTDRNLGEAVGSSTVTLQTSQIPAHIHLANCVDSPGNTNQPQGAVWSQVPAQGKFVKKQTPMYSDTPDAQMNIAALSTTGMGQPHYNRQPYLGISFIIALVGVFPPRS